MNSVVRCWVVFCAVVVAAGWALSCLHAVNVAGYLVVSAAILIGAGILLRWHFRSWQADACGARFRATVRRRFRRPLPLLFLVLALLAVAGGFLHPPNNYDALTYRIPRMMNWASEEHWHWIHSLNWRLNTRATVYEWLAMPLLLFTGSSRGFFLINALSFALLPGLVFRVFTRLGVRPRAAAAWMWLLPSGYSLVLQAGGISNDMVATPFVLAAVDFALRARRSQRAVDAWLSVLAAGLMTGVKGSNLPLLLPWFVALTPSWRLFVRTPARSAAVLLLAAMVSFLPTAVLNQVHCRDWSGAAVEMDPGTIPSRPLSVAANAVQLVIQNFAPPVFPAASWWNARVMGWLPGGFRDALLKTNFGDRVFILGELPVEDTAVLGLGLSALIALSVGWVGFQRLRGSSRSGAFHSSAMVFNPRFTALLCWLPWVSLAAYMAGVGTTCAGRLITPYYPLLLVGLLAGAGHETLARRVWWRHAGGAVLLLAMLIVVVNPARSLWPAQAVLGAIHRAKPGQRLVERAARVYETYAERHDALSPARRLLPEEARCVGLAGALDYPEASLWRPFGSRRVMHVLPGDTAGWLREAGIEYVLLTPDTEEIFKMPLVQWLAKYEAVSAAQVEFTHLASQGPRTWHLARLLPATPNPPP